MKHVLTAVFCLLAMAAPALLAEQSLPPGFDPNRHMLVSEVKDGMTGYGLSVFHGTKLERFDVTVISVLHNFNPKFDVVLVRCKGANLEHTGAIAGMSGSPIYLKDDKGRERMIGAFAYGWPMMKDPVGGVQPIQYMLGIPSEPAKVLPEPGTHLSGAQSSPAIQRKARWSIDEAMSVPWKPVMGRANPLLRLDAGKSAPLTGDLDEAARLRPLATPLMTTGVPQRVLDQFEPIFRSYGIVALQAGSAAVDGERGGPAAKLEPGSAIAVPLMTGDMDMTAIGTVTEVQGDRVVAFGHSFFSEGEVSLPMSSGYIHTVIANLSNSFKLGAATELRGTLVSDQVVGIGGKIGPSPRTIPMEIRCVYADGSFDQTYRFNASLHPKFTPIMAAVATTTALTSRRDLPQYHTVDYDVTMEFANGQTIHLQNRTANANGPEMMMAISQPIMAAMENPFERVALKKLTGTFKVVRDAKEAQILSVSVPKEKYRPGETVKAFVTYRPFRQAEQILPVDFEIPKDIAEGQYDFGVLDSQGHLADEQQAHPFRFTAENTSEMFAVLRDYMGVRRDALYLRLLRQPDGVAIGRTALPRLPSSRRKVLLGAGLSDVTLFVSSTLKTVSTPFIMNGQAHFQLTIDKEAKVEVPSKGKRDVVTPSPAAPKTDDKTKPIIKPEKPPEAPAGDAEPGK
jgi:hypothetical protein